MRLSLVQWSLFRVANLDALARHASVPRGLRTAVETVVRATRLRVPAPVDVAELISRFPSQLRESIANLSESVYNCLHSVLA